MVLKKSKYSFLLVLSLIAVQPVMGQTQTKYRAGSGNVSDSNSKVPVGDMGVPAPTYLPSTIRFHLQGRKLIHRPNMDDKIMEEGEVRLRVTVNRDGDITNFKVMTAVNTANRNLALKKIQNLKFNKSETAPLEQYGEVDFYFRTTNK